jgi:hypothetical protein
MALGSTGRLLSATIVAGAFSAVTFAQGTTQGTTAQGAGGDRDQNRMVTVTGCIMAERDVPGRDESLFQRWGLTQRDYLLTQVQAQHHGQTGQQGQTGQYGQTGQTAQTGQQGQTGQYGQTGQAGQTGQTGQTAQGGQHDQHGQHGQAGQTGQTAQAGQHGQAGQAHMAGAHSRSMLKVEGKDADQLRQYVNQRVEIRGEIEDRNWFDRAFGRDGDRDRTAAAGTGATGAGTAGTAGTAGAGATGTGTAGTTGTGATGTTGTGTVMGTAGDDDRLRSIEVESIRVIGSC